MNYLHWDEKTITDFSDENIAKMYEHGYVFTRKGRGVMQQTRSVRIDLDKFELSSENRRILKKTDGLELDAITLPFNTADYDFKLGKLAKDFYDTKFGVGILSAQKIKEMLTDKEKSNFNTLLTYSLSDATNNSIENTIANSSTKNIGFVICYLISQPADGILHYSYPFYDLNESLKDMGMGMMIRAIEYAKSAGIKYIYLGSLQRTGDVYKLQFDGLEWFNGQKWSTDVDGAKKVLKSD